MQLRTEPLELHTVFEFRIAHGARRAHTNTLVRLSHEGIEGLGEAAPSHYYGETPATVEAALAEWAPHLGDDPFAWDALEQRLDSALQGHGAARAGLEMALHDWIGKKLGVPTWQLLGLDAARTPRSCVTLGMASPEEMEKKLETVKDFPLIKVKLGGPGDVDNLRRIRARYKGKLQVDANTAWNAADAVRVLRQIERRPRRPALGARAQPDPGIRGRERAQPARHRPAGRQGGRREPEDHEDRRHPRDAAHDPRCARARHEGHARLHGRVEPRAVGGRAVGAARRLPRSRRALAAA
jgi:hypothetical protein